MTRSFYSLKNLLVHKTTITQLSFNQYIIDSLKNDTAGLA